MLLTLDTLPTQSIANLVGGQDQEEKVQEMCNDNKGYQPRSYIIKKDVGAIIPDAIINMLSTWEH